ncbi:MAG: type I 3-dehydroquinate dehydratase [Methanosarcinales archaeon Met12]|nr:MAG: type I 3-dehydroquinate dehydratase [Methanosarcinales archaeon Met12]
MIEIGGVVLDSPRIVGVVDSIDAAIGAEKAGADLLEVRIDLLDRGIEVTGFLDDVREASSLPTIVTNRPEVEGGAFKGSENERISMLYTAMGHADAVDVELSTATTMNVVIQRAKEQKIPLIVSYHEFNRTPPDEEIMKILNDARNIGGVEKVIPKIAVMANSLGDVLRLLRLTIEASKPLCTIAMGELGKHSRVIAPLYGSALTYGHVDGAKAPGQLSVSELKAALDICQGSRNENDIWSNRKSC